MLATRLPIEPGKSADSEHIGQDFAFLMGLKSPEVVMDVDKSGTGTAQRFVEGRDVLNVADLQEQMKNDPDLAQQMELMGVMDWIIMNSDRHAGNLKVNGKELLSLDLGGAFAEEEFDKESYESIKADIYRENPGFKTYQDLTFDELPHFMQVKAAKYARDRLRDCGTNSVALELLRREGVTELSQKTLQGVERIKTMMEDGESSPMFIKMKVAWGEDIARRRWNKIRRRVDTVLETKTLPQNSERWHKEWSKPPKTRIEGNKNLPN
jgi:hypothetical protein